jgi:hypothetical protein
MLVEFLSFSFARFLTRLQLWPLAVGPAELEADVDGVVGARKHKSGQGFYSLNIHLDTYICTELTPCHFLKQ